MSPDSRDTPEPRSGYFLLWTDGGMESDGNRTHGQEPGDAAIGAVLMDRKMRTLDTISEAIGPKANTVAEYRPSSKG